jgi:hypothetical protein
MVAILIAVVLVAGVACILSSPWRVRRAARRNESVELTTLRGEVAELAAARDAKYREIRDAELDHQTGKLSDADFNTVDGALRAEAIALLKRLDRAQTRLEKLIKREAGESDAPFVQEFTHLAETTPDDPALSQTRAPHEADAQ